MKKPSRKNRIIPMTFEYTYDQHNSVKDSKI